MRLHSAQQVRKLRAALAGLDAGRLGITAVAVGLAAQGALDDALAYAKQRETFGQPLIREPCSCWPAWTAAVDSARATMLAAARRKDAGLPYSRQASIAKLVATEAAMRVTTDAVQVFGGAGCTRDFPVERYMREAKVMQVFEGTNQIQRLVISRDLVRAGADPPSTSRARRPRSPRHETHRIPTATT